MVGELVGFCFLVVLHVPQFTEPASIPKDRRITYRYTGGMNRSEASFVRDHIYFTSIDLLIYTLTKLSIFTGLDPGLSSVCSIGCSLSTHPKDFLEVSNLSQAQAICRSLPHFFSIKPAMLLGPIYIVLG